MAGHRRISTDLFLEHIDRKGTRSKVEALLELDLDDWKGERQSVRSYSRIWRWSRDKVERLIEQYDAHRDDLCLQNRGESRPASDRPPNRPQTGQLEGQENAVIPLELHRPPATKPATNRPPNRPQTGHSLEPDPIEPEGEEKRLPPLPLAPRKIDAVESRTRQAEHSARVALDFIAPGEDPRRPEVARRLDVLSGIHLATGKIPDAQSLRAYAVATRRIPSDVFEDACIEAFASNERGFMPSAHTIIACGKSLAAQARKRARGSHG